MRMLARSEKEMLIGGEWFRNSAAKFWPWLKEKTRAEYPDARAVELTALCGDRLTRRMLDPAQSLQDTIDRVMAGAPMPSLEDTLAELEMIGGPAPVRVRVLGEGETVLAEETPGLVDAEPFPFLVVWLLEWAGVPDTRWNDLVVEGAFMARDTQRDAPCRMSFSLWNEHVSEGLFERRVRVKV